MDCLIMLGRREDAQHLFEKLLAVRSDLGLMAEEYDPAARRQLGNFPQAFSHIGLVNSAVNLSRAIGTVNQRTDTEPDTARPTGKQQLQREPMGNVTRV